MPTRFSFEGIGTTWNIGIEDISAHDGARIEKIVQSRVAEFNAVYSRFREDSWVAKLSQKAGKYELPADAEPMLSLYRDLYDITEGLVTPLIGQTLVDAGYDKDYSFVEKKTLARPPKWDEAIQYEPHAHPPVIIIKTPVLIDVGAIGKGYLIDIIRSCRRKDIPGFFYQRTHSIISALSDLCSTKIYPAAARFSGKFYKFRMINFIGIRGDAG